MTSGQTEDLAVRLHQWSVQEMHFTPRFKHVNSKPPTVESFRSVCRGQLIDIWKFVLTRVHSRETVKKVKGNLALKRHKTRRKSDSKVSEEVKQLQEERDRLRTELKSTLSDIGLVEADLARQKRDILRTEELCKEATGRVQDLQRRSTLLTSYSQQVQEDVQIYQEFVQRIHTKTDRLLSLSRRGSEKNSVTSGQSTELYDGGLETACTRRVRDSCDSLGSFLKQLVQGSFNRDDNLLAKRKELVWEKVDDVMSEFPVNQVVLSLSINAHNATMNLRDMTAKIDIRKDAENLRFRYEQGSQIADISTPPSILQSVHDLLMESHANNIKTFVAAEKSKNHVWKLQPRLQEGLDLIDKQLTHSHRGNPGALDLAKNLFNTELEITVSRSALRTIEGIAEEMKEKIASAMQEKEILYNKYQKIQDFTKLADSKQNLIRVLVKQNVDARTKLEEQQLEILKYIQTALGSHEAETKGLALKLKDAVKLEVESFAGLVLPYLMCTVLESSYKIAVIDLSIHRLSGNALTAGGLAIRKMIESLEFPVYQAPECFLAKVVELQNEVYEMEAILQRPELLAQDTCQQKAIVDNISKLCQNVAANDADQEKNILPVLQNRLARATRALTDCLRVKDTVQEWWEQPGQTASVGFKVDDLTLQQWRDKWTVAVTRLRQFQVQK